MRLRSVLFAPASKPDVIAKMPRSGADAVVLDLEDAVPSSAKGEARRHARLQGPELAGAYPGLAVFVRVNSPVGPYFADDLAALSPQLAGVVVPKLESAAQVASVMAALADAGLGLHVFAGIETVAGVVNAGEVAAAPGVAAVYFGAEDYVADLGGVRTREGTEVLYARSRVAIAARMAGVPAVDQIVAELRDDDRFASCAALGRSLGYRGKLCIHPAQVALANTAFSPSDSELQRARRLLDAYEAAASRGEASIDFEGQMVDEPLARQARAVLDSAVT